MKLNERSQSEKNKFCMIPTTWHSCNAKLWNIQVTPQRRDGLLGFTYSEPVRVIFSVAERTVGFVLKNQVVWSCHVVPAICFM